MLLESNTENHHSHQSMNPITQITIIPTSMRTITVAITAAVAALIMSILSMHTPYANAQNTPRSIDQGMILIAIDASLQHITDIEFAQIAASLILDQSQNEAIAVGQFGATPTQPQLYPRLDAAQTQIDTIAQELKENQDNVRTPASLTDMLPQYVTFMEQIGAPKDISKLIILSAGKFDDPENTTPDNVAVLADRFKTLGIKVDSVALPSTSAGDREILARIASETNGSATDLGFKDGIKTFISQTLDIELQTVLQAEAVEQLPVTNTTQIPPHTTQMVIAVAFDDIERTNTLTSPSGQEFTKSAPTIQVQSTSTLKLFIVQDPEPGGWVITSTGESSEVAVFAQFKNPVQLVIQDNEPFPTSSQITLKVSTRVNNQPHIDSSAVIDAIATHQDTSVETYTLNDLGQDGDETAEDGTFTVITPPIDKQGVRNVLFQMKWEQYVATIEQTGSFSVEPFPQAVITTNEEDPGMASERVPVATLDLSVGGYPYLITPDQITINVIDQADGSDRFSAIEPIAPQQNGTAFQFQIYANIQQNSNFDISASINTNYLERDYQFTTSSTASIQLATPSLLRLWPIFLLIAIVLSLLITGALMLILRPKPFGYIYQMHVHGEKELVADMANFKFAFLERIISSNVVPAAALPGLPLRGGTFVFSKNSIGFNYKPERDGDLRMTINGIPVSLGTMQIPDKADIKIGNDSYLFSKEPETGDVSVSSVLQNQARREELSRFVQDPMTFDAPENVRPTRRL